MIYESPTRKRRMRRRRKREEARWARMASEVTVTKVEK